MRPVPFLVAWLLAACTPDVADKVDDTDTEAVESDTDPAETDVDDTDRVDTDRRETDTDVPDTDTDVPDTDTDVPDTDLPDTDTDTDTDLPDTDTDLPDTDTDTDLADTDTDTDVTDTDLPDTDTDLADTDTDTDTDTDLPDTDLPDTDTDLPDTDTDTDPPNRPPEITGLTLTPRPTVTTGVTATATTADPDGDPVTVAYAWTVDGTLAQTGPDAVLPPGAATRGQIVAVVATPSDGQHTGTPASASTIVVNSPPDAPDVLLLPRAARPGLDDLVCTLRTGLADADGDVVTSTVSWTLDGLPWTATATTTLPGDTVAAADVVPGTWICTVTAADAIDVNRGSDTQVVGSQEIVDVVVTTGLTCVLRADGTPNCFGSGLNDLQDVPEVPLHSLDAGSTLACGLDDDDEAVCWGRFATTYPPPAGPFTELVVGSLFACALRTSGEIACWGANNHHQLDAPLGTYIHLAAYNEAGCAESANGAVTCWGQNAPPGMAAGPVMDHLVIGNIWVCGHPTGTSSIRCGGFTSSLSGVWSNYRRLLGRANELCIHQANGTLACLPSASTPGGIATMPATELASKSGSVAAGLDAAGALVASGLFSYGATQAPTERATVPVALPLNPCWLDDDGFGTCVGFGLYGEETFPPVPLWTVDTGTYWGCGLDAVGAIRCWGHGLPGAHTPPGGVYTALSVGDDAACAVADDRSVHCWGNDVAGETTPPANLVADTVAVGFDHACALDDATQALTCWGNSTAGATAAPSGPFVDVRAGKNMTCGVRPDGAGVCWGTFFGGGSAVAPAGTFDVLIPGRLSICGLERSGAITCISNLDRASTHAPPGTFTGLDLEDDNVCAVDTAQRLWCWGTTGRRPL